MKPALAFSVIANCCPCGSYDTGGDRSYDEDVLFHHEPRWLGGDGAYSIDLGHDRTLWLFGDSFIATSPALERRESTLVRNSIAVMTGHDPLTATMEYAWSDGSPPSAYFPDAGDHWFWPMHGVRLPDGPLVVFLAELRPADGGLGFAGAGYRAIRVVDPDGPPSSWVVEPLVTTPAPHDADTAVGSCTTVIHDVDRDYLVAVAADGDDHDGRLARWPLDAIAAGDVATPEWWNGASWVSQSALAGEPAIVLPDAGSECSLFFDEDSYVYLASRGFGASTIALRWSFSVEGKWSAPEDVFTPPESDVPDAFVYAAKAHPHLSPLGGEYFVTYADNSFVFQDLFDPERAQTLYWPHVARVRHVFDCD